jgi:L-seryl-tRNA(Ser) seleniumtransferase
MRLACAVRKALPDADVEIREGFSQAGGGSLPGVEIPTLVIAARTVQPVHRLEAKLRQHDPPVMVRVHNGQVLFDPRALWPDDIDVISSALQAAAGACALLKGMDSL